MIAAVDTNVLLDAFLPDEHYGHGSRERLRAACDAVAVVVSDVVYAELAAVFPDRATLDDAPQRSQHRDIGDLRVLHE